ncbi:hypothetical protein CXR29_06495 [Brevibacterium linens]|nr:hypothetical protein CXR29_06495 [Brevibacterium linens]
MRSYSKSTASRICVITARRLLRERTGHRRRRARCARRGRRGHRADRRSRRTLRCVHPHRPRSCRRLD